MHSPDFNPWRKPFYYRTLRCPDEGLGACAVVVFFKIHCQNESFSGFGMGSASVYQQHTRLLGNKNAFVLCTFSFHYLYVLFSRPHSHVQGKSRENKVQSGRVVSYFFLHFLPVFRLGCVLVTGHYRPLLHVNAFFGQQN